MDKKNYVENAVEVKSVTTEHPKSKNRIRKRHESKLHKTLRIIKNIICWGVLAILVLTVIVFMGSKVNGKTPSLFGYSVLRVSTGSMEPELMIGDVILGKSVDDPTALKVGDIITYRGSGQTEGLLVTHKVVVAPYKTADGTYKLQTKGIANDAPDPEISTEDVLYISEFNDIPEHLKDKRIDEIDRTPAENLAYQVGWTTLVIKWESNERKGIPVKTPSDNFKWNQLGELYQWFTDTYAQLSLQELKDRLNENINSIYAMIDSLSEEELFKPHMRKWADEATKTAVWEVYKFIHVNTVAPFGTFRTKIRKWKKIAL